MVSDNDNREAAATCPTPAPIQISQDCNIYVTELDASQQLLFPLQANRQAYLLCLEGQVSIQIQGSDQQQPQVVTLDQHDAAELFVTAADTQLVTRASDSSSTHVLMVEMAYTGRGRSDL
jgi:redox-sensitive bicupin YhaK (pirin superfamily)